MLQYDYKRCAGKKEPSSDAKHSGQKIRCIWSRLPCLQTWLKPELQRTGPLKLLSKASIYLKGQRVTSQPRQKWVSKAGNSGGYEEGPAVISPVFLTSLFHSFRMSVLDWNHHVILLVWCALRSSVFSKHRSAKLPFLSTLATCSLSVYLLTCSTRLKILENGNCYFYSGTLSGSPMAEHIENAP